MSRKFVAIILGLGTLILVAACAGGTNNQSARPTLALNAPTPTPETLPMPEQSGGKEARPTLDPNQPTPTPEALPPVGEGRPDPGQVQAPGTMPYSLDLMTADGSALDAQFYPAPQPGGAALLLVSASTEERPDWQLLAQTAQVKGLATLLLDVPQAGGASQALDAALAWLSAPENGGFEDLIVAASGVGAGPALDALARAPDIRAGLLFSPLESDPGLAEGLNLDRPLLVVVSEDDPLVASAGALQAAGNLELTTVPGSGHGVALLFTQPGLLDQVLDWCLRHIGV